MKVMIIDFADTNHISDLVPPAFDRIVENTDGNEAYKIVGKELPNIILINYKVKPSHGRQTAIAIKKRKSTAEIPIYFIDGTAIENEKVQSIGLCIKCKDVIKIWQS
jgi:response regulator RpfG family c-di-GMP phosphodiesterase